MRFQAFAVIFIAIMLPISMVLSYYIQIQSESIALESTYQSRLNNATYAAVSGYQMNSLNTQRVAGESIYSYVDASINTFHTTLATSMLQSNASKNVFRDYIPAILFTTYDGYYIYSPYKAAVAAINSSNGQNVFNKKKEIVYMKDDSPYLIDDGIARDIDSNWDNSKFTTNPEDARKDYNYKLKPFIYYSAEYKNGSNYDFVACYTLDNYLTLFGKCKKGSEDISFSKSGYAINPEDVTLSGKILVRTARRVNDDINETSLASKLEEDESNNSIKESTIQLYYNEDVNQTTKPVPVKFEVFDLSDAAQAQKIKEMIQDYTKYSNKNSHPELTYGSQSEKEEANKYYYTLVDDELDETVGVTEPLTRAQTGDRIINDTITIQEKNKEKVASGDAEWDCKKFTHAGIDVGEINVTYKGVKITDPDAKKYFIKAYYFSDWVTNNLGGVEEQYTQENKQIQEDKNRDKNKSNYDYYDGSGAHIFRFTDTGNDPNSDLSVFWRHKSSVIKNSIQCNLNSAISNFNEDKKVGTDYMYRMPILTPSDWDSILNNICMVAFMQGLPTGFERSFNNYAIVKSTNNNTYVTPDTLYFAEYVEKKSGIADCDYHKIDCPYLEEVLGDFDLNTSTPTLEADRSAEFKYDAKRINCLADINDNRPDPEIIAFMDDEENKFYKVEHLAENDYYTEDITVGDEITNPSAYDYNGHTYNLHEPDEVIVTSKIKYLFDHRNLACYDCIISGNFDSVVKYYDGNLYLTGYLPETGEMFIHYQEDNSTHTAFKDAGKWLNLDGSPYSTSSWGTPIDVMGAISSGSKYDCMAPYKELQKRRQALFNYLGKYRETQYKNNKYVNI